MPRVTLLGGPLHGADRFVHADARALCVPVLESCGVGLPPKFGHVRYVIDVAAGIAFCREAWPPAARTPDTGEGAE